MGSKSAKIRYVSAFDTSTTDSNVDASETRIIGPSDVNEAAPHLSHLTTESLGLEHVLKHTSPGSNTLLSNVVAECSCGLWANLYSYFGGLSYRGTNAAGS